MPLLEIKESRRVTATVSLEQSIAILVDRYAAFTNSIADDVVNQSLEYVFSRDKEFQKFLENPGDKRAKAELRVKHVAEAEPNGRRGRKAGSNGNSAHAAGQEENR